MQCGMELGKFGAAWVCPPAGDGPDQIEDENDQS